MRWAWTRLEGEGGVPGLPVGVPIETETATLVLRSPESDRFSLGRHRFRLVVRDDSGRVSDPAEVQVVVIDDQAPTAVLLAPEEVAFGEDIELDGRRSFDEGGGEVVSYRFRKISGAGGALPIGQLVITSQPIFVVSARGEEFLEVGEHVFELVVVDDSANQSEPDRVTVRVVD